MRKIASGMPTYGSFEKRPGGPRSALGCSWHGVIIDMNVNRASGSRSCCSTWGADGNDFTRFHIDDIHRGQPPGQVR